LTVWSIYQVFHEIECIETVGIHTDLLPNLRKTGVQIPIFTTSHSDRILVLGGRGLLQFWSIQQNEEGRMSLRMIEDIAQVYGPHIKNNTMSSCLCLPPPTRSSKELLDWIVIGGSDGKMYGFRFDQTENGSVALNDSASGRFRSNSHTEGVPIKKLVAIYGSSAFAHHRAVQNKALPYSLFLNGVPVEDKAFYSLGEDGKLLSWSFFESNGRGWAKTDEVHLGTLSSRIGSGWDAQTLPSASKFVAAHSSRLVPNITVVVDEERKLLVCYDRTKPGELPPDAAVQYDAAYDLR